MSSASTSLAIVDVSGCVLVSLTRAWNSAATCRINLSVAADPEGADAGKRACFQHRLVTGEGQARTRGGEGMISLSGGLDWGGSLLPDLNRRAYATVRISGSSFTLAGSDAW